MRTAGHECHGNDSCNDQSRSKEILPSNVVEGESCAILWDGITRCQPCRAEILKIYSDVEAAVWITASSILRTFSNSTGREMPGIRWLLTEGSKWQLSICILQDHIHTITSAACGVPVYFPFLTNDFFEFAFSSKFTWLNNNYTYKYQIKKILSNFVPDDIVSRKKVAFQSPSRAYFQKGSPFGSELFRLLAKPNKRFKEKAIVNAVNERLESNLSLHARYDFLEWNIYNVLAIDNAE